MSQPFDDTPELDYQERDQLLYIGSNGRQLLNNLRKGKLQATPTFYKKLIRVEFEDRPEPRQYVVDGLFKLLAASLQKQALKHYYGEKA